MKRPFTQVLCDYRSTQCKKYCKGHFHLQYSRADTRLTTQSVPHGAPSGIANSSSHTERGAAEGSGSAGLSNATPSDGTQPPVVSTTSSSSNDGGKEDPEEITQLLEP